MTRRMCWAALASFLLLTPSLAVAQAVPDGGVVVEADPVRCWWRTDRASIRMGEPFEAVLTCAALETAGTRVVVDRSRLDPTVFAVPPFDVLGGTTAEDATTASRRFFQYHLPAAPAERRGLRSGRVARRARAHLPHRYLDQRRHDLTGA